MRPITSWKIPIDDLPWFKDSSGTGDDTDDSDLSYGFPGLNPPPAPGIPGCFGQGLHCARLYTPANIANYTVTVLRSILSVIVFYLSAKLKGDVVAVMTLNLLIPSVICDMASTLALAIDIASLYHSGIEITEGSYAALLLAQGFTGMVCRLFTLFFVTMFLVAFTSPIFYHRRFGVRSKAPYFFAMHLFSVVCTTVALVPHLTEASVTVENGADIGYHVVLIMLTFGTLIVTIKAIVSLGKFKSSINSNDELRRNRRRLISFLAYCIPMNILNIPLAVFVVTKINSLHDTETVVVLEYVNNFFVATEYQLRTIIICLCVLIALTPYRKALCSVVNKRRRQHVNTTTST